MSEQEMPGFDVVSGSSIESWIKRYGNRLVQRIQREAYEAGRQQERERLEPLRAVLADLDAAEGMVYVAGLDHFIETARTLLESDR